MGISFVDCDPDRDFELAIIRGLGAVHAPEDTEVRVCGDIAREVFDFLGVPYSAARPGGVVGGRTLPSPNGGSVIFLNGSGFNDEDANGGLTPVQAEERLAAHEGCHASMEARERASTTPPLST